MWWGDGEPLEVAEGLPAATQHDIAGAAAADSAATGHQVEQELHNLQEQFAVQQELLGSLKSRLPQSASSHQDYATRLAAMRSRLGRPQHKHAKQQQLKQHDVQEEQQQHQQHMETQSFHTESVTVDPSVTPFEVVHKDLEASSLLDVSAKVSSSMMDVSVVGSATAVAASIESPYDLETSSTGSVSKKARTASFSEGTSQSKIQLLRKTLDENRTKFERQQRDNREKKANMEEMRKKIDKLRNELEERDEFIQSFEKGIISLHSQPTTQQLCQQLLQKDAIVLGLSARVSELETLCQDQKERLDEKDCIIEARTEAVALVTKDRDEKLLRMIEDLEERQVTMREMQQDFTCREGEWNNDRDALSKALAEKSGRVAQLEENCRRIESIRFELSTRNAELQEKIVTLQSEQSEMQAEMTARTVKCSEYSDCIRDLKQKLCKAEAHGRTKLKYLEKQFKAMKQDDGEETGQKILDLHNQIALLEEEKGNLQLRMVDFDDIKASNAILEQNLVALNKKREELNTNVISHSASISALENEKIKLVEVLNDREIKLFDLESNIMKFEEENQELAESKAALENAVQELELKLQSSHEDRQSLQAQLEEQLHESSGADNRVTEVREKLEATIAQLTEELQELRNRSAEQVEEMNSCKERYKLAEQEHEEKSEYNERLLSILTNKEDSLTNQSIEIDKANALIAEYRCEIDELNRSLENVKQESDNSASKYQLEIDNLQDIISDKEAELNDLAEKHRFESDKMVNTIEELEKLRQRLVKQQEVLHETEDELADYKQQNNRLHYMLEDNDKLIKDLRKEISDLKTLVDADRKKLTNLTTSVQDLSSKLIEVEASREKLESLNVETERNLLLKSSELEILTKDCANTQRSLNECLHNLQERSEEIVALTEARDNIVSKLNQELCLKSETLHHVQQEVKEKDVYIETLEGQCQLVQKNLECSESERDEKSSMLTDLENQVAQHVRDIAVQEGSLSVLQNNVTHLNAEIDSYKKYNETLNDKLIDKEQTLLLTIEQVQSLTTELESCKNDLANKDGHISELNQRLMEDNLAMSSSVEKQVQLYNEAKADMEATLNAERQAYAKSSEKILQEKKTVLNDLNEKLNASIYEVTLLTSRIRAKEDELDEAVNNLTSKESEYSALQVRFDELRQYHDEANANVSILQKSLEDKTQELLQQTLLQRENEGKITEMQERIESLVSKMQEKEKQLVLDQQQMEEKVASLGKTDCEKQVRIDELQEEISRIQAEYSALKQYSDDYVQCQKQWEEWAASVQEEKTITHQELDATKASLETTLQQLQEKEQAVSEQIAAKNALETNIESLMGEIQKNKVFIETLAEEKRSLETMYAQDLKSQVQSKDEHIHNLEQQLHAEKELRSRSSSRQSEHSEEGRHQMHLIQEQCSQLQQQLREAHLKITQLETSLGISGQGRGGPGAARIGDVNIDEDESLLGEVDLRDSFSSSAGQTPVEVLQLQQVLAEKTYLVEQMQEQLRTLKNTLHSQEEEMTLMFERTQISEKRCKELQNNCQHLQQQVNAADATSNTVRSLEEELTSLRTLMTSMKDTHEKNIHDQLQTQQRQFETQLASLRGLNEQITGQQCQIQELQGILEQKDAGLRELESLPGLEISSVATDASQFFAQGDTKQEAATTSGSSVALFTPVVTSGEDGDRIKHEGDFSESSTLQEKLSFEPLSELQFKLSWYEEQWPTWTEHYNQLQQNYADSQAKIAELTQLLEMKNVEETESEAASDAGATAIPSTGVPCVSDTTGDVTCTSIVASEETEIVKEGYSEQAAQYKALQAQYENLYYIYNELQQQLISLQLQKEEVSKEKGKLEAELLDQSQKKFEQTMPPSSVEEQKAEPFTALHERNVEEMRSSAELQDANSRVEKGLTEIRMKEEQIIGLEIQLQQLQADLQAAQQQGGGSGRAAELELIVASAEAEITRLKGQLQLQQEERVGLCERISSLEAEQLTREASVVVMEEERLEFRELQDRLQRENSTLRSELEVMEGEHSRRTTDIEILEADNTRLRNDFDLATQSNQILEAEKESLVMEIQRLEQQKEMLNREIQDTNLLSEGANEQILSLHQQLVDLQQHQHRQQTEQQQQSPQGIVGAEFADDELDWGSEGTKEFDHFQRASSHDSSLKEELESLKQVLINTEREKNALSDELQASKVKCGKLLQKVKNSQSKNESLQKDIDRLKSMKGGLSNLDQALEDEFKTQVQQAQTERDELKQRLEEVLKEKDQYVKQSEVLKDAHDRFIELKEDQDEQIRMLKSRNKSLESTVSSMEWKISELEEAVEEQRQQQVELSVLPGTAVAEEQQRLSFPQQEVQVFSKDTATDVQYTSEDDSKQLRDQIIALEVQLDELSSSNMKIESINKDLNERLIELEDANRVLLREKVQLESDVSRLKEESTKASKDVSVYKEAFIQQQQQFENLTDEKTSLDEKLSELNYQRNILHAEYNSLYEENEELQKEFSNLKYEYNLMDGERDRLILDVNVLTAELEAFRQDRLEDTVRALEEEVTQLRAAYAALKEEATEHSAQLMAAQDRVEKVQRDLLQSRGALEESKARLHQQSQDERQTINELERMERVSVYTEAELTAATAKVKRLEEALKAAERDVSALQEQVRHWQQQSQHLSRQVESADASLSRLSEVGDRLEAETGVGAGAELQAALASLHLRDLRCHHLIMEINKLVEERDSLQLRLSSALRTTQEMQRHMRTASETEEQSDEQQEQVVGVLAAPLKTKLDQLRELNDEVEQKTLASLPPSPFTSHTAPSSPAIITPEYTLTRETQATSSTLINWIMGRTTPRVMHV